MAVDQFERTMPALNNSPAPLNVTEYQPVYNKKSKLNLLPNYIPENHANVLKKYSINCKLGNQGVGKIFNTSNCS